MKLELYNYMTEETTTFESIEEFIYWFNFIDEHSDLKIIKEEVF